MKRDRSDEKRDRTGRDTLARARPTFGRVCHAVTLVTARDVTAANRDSDTPSLGRASPSRFKSDHRKKQKKLDPRRFDAWLAGATQEQADAWAEHQRKLAQRMYRLAVDALRGN